MGGFATRSMIERRLSQREAARCFGIDPRTVRKMLSYSVPPGYVRTRPAGPPEARSGGIGIIDRILEEDKDRRFSHNAQYSIPFHLDIRPQQRATNAKVAKAIRPRLAASMKNGSSGSPPIMTRSPTHRISIRPNQPRMWSAPIAERQKPNRIPPSCRFPLGLPTFLCNPL